MTRNTDISDLVAIGAEADRKLEDVKLAAEEAAAELAIMIGPGRAAFHFAQISIGLAKLADSEAGI